MHTYVTYDERHERILNCAANLYDKKLQQLAVVIIN